MFGNCLSKKCLHTDLFKIIEKYLPLFILQKGFKTENYFSILQIKDSLIFNTIRFFRKTALLFL